METCYLKRINYYDGCRTCRGEDTNPCYQNKTDVSEHIAHLHRLFAQRLETESEESLEELFEVHSGGFL